MNADADGHSAGSTPATSGHSAGSTPAAAVVGVATTRKQVFAWAMWDWGSAAFNASRIVGPSIAGALILLTNIGFVLALCALIFLVFFLLLTEHFH